MYVDFDVWRTGVENETHHRVTTWLTRDNFYITHLHDHPQLAPHLLPVVHRLGAALPCACPLMHQLVHTPKRHGTVINTSGTGRATRGPSLAYRMQPREHQSHKQVQDVLQLYALRWRPQQPPYPSGTLRDSARLLLQDLGVYRGIQWQAYPKELLFKGDVAPKVRSAGAHRHIRVPLLLYMNVRKKFIYSPGKYPFLPEESRRSREDNAWIYKGVQVLGTQGDRLTCVTTEYTFVDT